MPYAVVNTGTILKKACIVNIGALVDHDWYFGGRVSFGAWSCCKGGKSSARRNKGRFRSGGAPAIL